MLQTFRSGSLNMHVECATETNEEKTGAAAFLAAKRLKKKASFKRVSVVPLIVCYFRFDFGFNFNFNCRLRERVTVGERERGREAGRGREAAIKHARQIRFIMGHFPTHVTHSARIFHSLAQGCMQSSR